MAGKKFEKGSKEWEMFSEFWDLTKKANAFMRKYDCEFTKDLIKSLHLTKELTETQTKVALTDFWMLCQKYWDCERTDDYWENLVDDTNAYHKKSGNDFSKSMAIAFINKLEKDYRK